MWFARALHNFSHVEDYSIFGAKLKYYFVKVSQPKRARAKEYFKLFHAPAPSRSFSYFRRCTSEHFHFSELGWIIMCISICLYLYIYRLYKNEYQHIHTNKPLYHHTPIILYTVFKIFFSRKRKENTLMENKNNFPYRFIDFNRGF